MADQNPIYVDDNGNPVTPPHAEVFVDDKGNPMSSAAPATPKILTPGVVATGLGALATGAGYVIPGAAKLATESPYAIKTLQALARIPGGMVVGGIGAGIGAGVDAAIGTKTHIGAELGGGAGVLSHALTPTQATIRQWLGELSGETPANTQLAVKAQGFSNYAREFGTKLRPEDLKRIPGVPEAIKNFGQSMGLEVSPEAYAASNMLKPLGWLSKVAPILKAVGPDLATLGSEGDAPATENSPSAVAQLTSQMTPAERLKLLDFVRHDPATTQAIQSQGQGSTVQPPVTPTLPHGAPYSPRLSPQEAALLLDQLSKLKK